MNNKNLVFCRNKDEIFIYTFNKISSVFPKENHFASDSFYRFDLHEFQELFHTPISTF